MYNGHPQIHITLEEIKLDVANIHFAFLGIGKMVFFL